MFHTPSEQAHPPVHGNYHGYYSKRPTTCDTRLAVLPRDAFSGKMVLDIGCNEGWVTCEIAQSWGAKNVVGVDIDETLIRAAWRRRITAWSLQQPRDDATSDPGPNYFPQAFEHTLGPLPIPPAREGDKDHFPHNLVFRCSDWTDEAIPEDVIGYDVVLALSVSKWIHLNQGDKGLEAFFERIHTVLRPNGMFIFEPQAWETYKKARRMDNQLKESAKELKLRPETFPDILRQTGFELVEDFGVVGEGGFSRPLQLYRKIL